MRRPQLKEVARGRTCQMCGKKLEKGTKYLQTFSYNYDAGFCIYCVVEIFLALNPIDLNDLVDATKGIRV